MSDSIPKKVLQNLGQIGEETVKEAVTQAGEIGASIITGKELLGNITPMSDEELAKKKREDENKKANQMSDVRSQLTGRDVEGEMKQVRQEAEQKENEEERMMREINAKREQEAAEIREAEAAMLMQATRRKGPVGPSQPKKKSMPDAAAMSNTSEFKGKVD